MFEDFWGLVLLPKLPVWTDLKTHIGNVPEFLFNECARNLSAVCLLCGKASNLDLSNKPKEDQISANKIFFFFFISENWTPEHFKDCSQAMPRHCHIWITKHQTDFKINCLTRPYDELTSSPGCTLPYPKTAEIWSSTPCNPNCGISGDGK